MNVLVTGAFGQLGNEFKFISGLYKNYNFVFNDKDTLDITKIDEVKYFLNNNKIDFIINTAAYTAVDEAEKEYQLAEEVNVIGPKNLAIISQETGTKLIHISTNYVFDGEKSGPYLEEDETNPLSVYGRTKRDGEKEVLYNTDNAVIIRLSWLYSRWINLEYCKNFIKTILKLAKERKELNVVYDQLGTPVYAGDAAVAIMDVINNWDSKSKVESEDNNVFHYSNSGVSSWYDFAEAILEYADVDCKINPIETKDYPVAAKRPKNGILSILKIKKFFNIEVPYWRDSLKVCLKSIDSKNAFEKNLYTQ